MEVRNIIPIPVHQPIEVKEARPSEGTELTYGLGNHLGVNSVLLDIGSIADQLAPSVWRFEMMILRLKVKAAGGDALIMHSDQSNYVGSFSTANASAYTSGNVSWGKE